MVSLSKYSCATSPGQPGAIPMRPSSSPAVNSFTKMPSPESMRLNPPPARDAIVMEGSMYTMADASALRVRPGGIVTFTMA